MPNRPDLPCAGCGKMLWRGATSLPAGRARCRPCRRIPPCPCGFCGAEFQPHTVGNVRIICRLCNQKRPNDGSDFVGQPTLWAEDPDVVPKPIRAKKAKPPKPARVLKPQPSKPQPRPCRTCGTEIVPSGRGRPRMWCEECRPAAPALRVAA